MIAKDCPGIFSYYGMKKLDIAFLKILKFWNCIGLKKRSKVRIKILKEIAYFYKHVMEI